MRRTWNLLISTLALAPALALAGCSVGEAEDPNNSADAGTTVDPTPGDALRVSGDITQSATWSGAVELVGPAVIKSGVTITVAAGAQITALDVAQLQVEGTLSVEGTAASKVTINASGTTPWNGIIVESGGSASIAHATGSKVQTLLQCKTGAVGCTLDSVEFNGIGRGIGTEAVATVSKSKLTGMLNNGGVFVGSGGNLTITDSYISNAASDVLVTNTGSRLSIEYSEIGSTATGEHCNIHVNGADALSVTRSVITASDVALMISNTNGMTITNSNILGNRSDWSAGNSNNVNANLTGNYWQNGVPTGLPAGINVGGASATPLTDVGPRQ